MDAIAWCQEETTRHTTTRELLKSCKKLLEPCGIKHVSYARTDLNGLSCVETSYPGAWLEHYKENELHEADPVITACHVDSTLHAWPETSKHPEHTEFFSMAESFGVPTQGAAVTFPTRTGFCVFSMAFEGSSKEWHRHLDANSIELNFVAMAFSIRAAQLKDPVQLTPRERDVLLWTARGKTSWETGQILGLTEGTVNQYLRTVIEKMGVANRVECVAKALDLGLLSGI